MDFAMIFGMSIFGLILTFQGISLIVANLLVIIWIFYFNSIIKKILI